MTIWEKLKRWNLERRYRILFRRAGLPLGGFFWRHGLGKDQSWL